MTARESGLDESADGYILLCAGMLDAVQRMRADVDSWPPSVQKMACRIAAELEDLDDRIRGLLDEFASTL